MGISGLLPFLKKASRPANVSEFSGKTAAIDVYCWMHKGAFGCADKLAQNQYTDGYVTYVMKYVDMLAHFNVKPILVFDGRNLPSKSETEKKRRENRSKNRQMALEYLREGRVREARECFQRSVDITPAMARHVIEACRQRNIDCIVAPYEADAQLAFLNLNGIADFIISEDSDLAPFGCTQILFKMDISGNGTLFENEKINLCLGIRAEKFTFEKFRYMCIMAGCDYQPSLPGIGLGKSCKFWNIVTNSDLMSVLPKIPNYLNMSSLEVTADYIRGFIQANNTFLYQLVFDPQNRTLRPLNDYPADVDKRNNPFPFCGAYLPAELAYQMALGNVDLNSLDIVDHFDPDEYVEIDPNFRPRYGRRLPHASIWWKGERQSRHLAAEREEAEKLAKKKTEFQKAFSLPTGMSDRSFDRKRKTTNAHLCNADQEEEQDNIVASYRCAKKSKFESPAKKAKLESSVKQSSDSSSSSARGQRIVFVSKYFAGSSKSGPVDASSERPKNIELKNPIEFDDSEDKQKAPKKSQRQSGEWLNELEKNVEDRNALAYKTLQAVKSSSDDAKENVLAGLTKLTPLSSLIASQDVRKAFKPKEESNDDVTEKEFSKKRNPFAKKSSADSFRPISPTVNSSTDVLQSTSLSQFSSQPPVELCLSQISFEGFRNEGQVLTSPSQRSNSSVESLGDAISPTSTTSCTVSPYFAHKNKPETKQFGSSQKKRVPVSGLMKRGSGNKSDHNQPKIFDLWGKKKI